MTTPTDRHMEEARKALDEYERDYPCPAACGHCEGCAARYVIDQYRSALAAESARSYSEGIEAAAKEAEERYVSLVAWMNKLPIRSEERKDKSVRAGECAEVAAAIRGLKR